MEYVVFRIYKGTTDNISGMVLNELAELGWLNGNEIGNQYTKLAD